MVITKAEYEKAKNAVNNAYTKESVDAYSKAYNDAMKSGKTSKEAYSSASGLLKKNETTGGGSSNINSTDVYGDVSGVSQKVGAKDYSNYTKTDLGDLGKYGESARAMERAKSGSISQRNDIIAGNLYTDKKYGEQDVRDYLSKQAGFNEADEVDRENTVRAITERLKAMQEEGAKSGDGSNLGEDLNLQNLGDKVPGAEGKAGFYNTKDGLQKIYGYDEMDEETKNLVDRLDDSKKKYVSNLWAQGMQEDLKYYLHTMRTKDQARARQDINQDLYDINRESSLIQAEQTIRNAEESYNNLKQNWQYLGNLGMPGVSSTKIQAIGDAITEAKTTLGEVKRLTQLSLDAQEKQWEGQVLQYNQQIDNLMYDLKWKVGDEITNALSKYTTAELEGKLDTIDGITAFRKELLDDLDNNLSGLTSASLTQMQWINQQYQDIANKMYDYAQNANKVNTEMSTVKGYYVDGNGNPILNNQGQPIQVPQNAPMEPIFDKETGKLITFGLDENGQIVASVQQVYQGDATNMQATIVSLLEQGVSVQDILKYVPNADLKTVQSLAEIVKPLGGGGGIGGYEWQGANYNQISKTEMLKGAKEFRSQFYTADGKLKQGIKGGQCGHFVNNYLQKLGVGRIFTDPITEKEKNINSDVPMIGSIVIMNSPTSPQYGHVGIVTGVKDGKISILQSNKKGEEAVFVSTKDKNDSDILGYFDPSKSISQFNQEIKGAVYQNEGLNKEGYKENDVSNYNAYLSKGYKAFTDSDKANIVKEYGSLENFRDAATNYQKHLDNQVSDVSIDLLKTLYYIKDNMSSTDYWQAKNAPEWASKWGISSGGDWRTEIDHVIANETLNYLVNIKSQGATFGALSDKELGMLSSAANKLNYTSSYDKFMGNIDSMISGIEGSMSMRGYNYSGLRGQAKQEKGGGREKVSGGNLG